MKKDFEVRESSPRVLQQSWIIRRCAPTIPRVYILYICHIPVGYFQLPLYLSTLPVFCIYCHFPDCCTWHMKCLLTSAPAVWEQMIWSSRHTLTHTLAYQRPVCQTLFTALCLPYCATGVYVFVKHHDEHYSYTEPHSKTNSWNMISTGP